MGIRMSENRQRKNQFLIRLSDQEMAQLNRNVDRSGLTREAFIRKIIREETIYEALPLDYHLLRKDLIRIGVNMNQIAHIANTYGMINKKRYHEIAAMLQKYIKELDTRILLARKQGEKDEKRQNTIP